MVFLKCMEFLLLFLVTLSVAALAATYPRVVYVDYSKGTSDPKCWTGGVDTPCNSLDLATEGAQLLNSSVVVLQSDQQHGDLVCLDNTTCPAWFVPTNTTQCGCGNTLGGIVHCNETRKELMLLSCYCMTNDETLGLVVGACSYNCYYMESSSPSYSVYRHFYNISKYVINSEICDPLYRTGRLCGQCKEGFSPPVYSYDLRCVKCNGTDYNHYNLVEYIAVAFVPLTIFYIVVVAFRISATSPLMNGFVMVSQAMAAPSLVRITTFAIDLDAKYVYYRLPARSLFTLYGIWNLDFFRTLIPPICLPLDTLTTIAMDYAVALYPLVLIIITYIFIELHDRNCRIIVVVWKPFHWCLARFRRQWNMKRSVIDAFATFLLLPYFKLLSISSSLLIPAYLYNVYGEKVEITLYYDGTIDVYGEKHLPFAILAVGVLLVFIFLPLLLLALYPLGCFQKFLNSCKLNHHVLRAFSDVFQGSFKDGTNGSRDCRSFAALYLMVRIFGIAIYFLVSTQYFLLLAAIIFLTFVVLIASIRPYKKDVHNKIDTFLFVNLATFYLLLFALVPSRTREMRQITTHVLIVVLATLPLFYMAALVAYKMCIRSPWVWRKIWFLRRNEERESEEELRFADRILHPGKYSD